jgi:hypothetical protein
VRLTLAGVALAAVLEGLSNGIALLNPDVYDHQQRGTERAAKRQQQLLLWRGDPEQRRAEDDGEAARAAAS